MKKALTITFIATFFFLCSAYAQTISLENGWKFKTGDSAVWATPGYNDRLWKPIGVDSSWEKQGYPNYDGFGWYRIHVLIPSSIREKSFLKDSLRLDLGIIDDNDEVYLNGKLVARNGGRSGDIKSGFYGPRTYAIAANNPALLWDRDNLIAVRIYDSGGDGGIYGHKHQLAMAGLMDRVSINTDGDFTFGENSSLTKSIRIRTSGGDYKFRGKLDFSVSDPETGSVIYQKTNDADFSAYSPFTYTFTLDRLLKKSYTITYTFTDVQSGEKITKTEGTPYILTPHVKAKPRINGADVFGARPGNPFLYRIPATGQKPLKYSATGLPAGLSLNASTGIITGVVAQKGEYNLVLTASNRLGIATKKFTLKIGDLIGLTPALGWNSWNAFGLSVNDARVRTAAKTMSDKLSAHGWSYVNIDDGWEAPQRAADGAIVTNEKFPDMRALTDYVHSLGLRMGIYSSPGPRTCGGYLGSWQHEEQDAKTYGAWGIDYLKYDWCSYSEETIANPGLPELQKPYQLMRAALDKVPRDIMYSLCQYGWGDVWKWGADVGGNSWRTTGDINDTWGSLALIGFNQDKAAPSAQPGHFNDPDMLIVGKVGWGDSQHNTRLTPDEQYTHISLWSMLSAPLLIGCDMGKLDEFTMNLLTNDEVLAIDQDALGKEARQLILNDNYQVWFKDLSNGDKAVAIFNTSDQYQTVALDRKANGLAGLTKVRDVWQQIYLITKADTYTAKVAPHGVAMVRFSR
jgi:hypothetical protein